MKKHMMSILVLLVAYANSGNACTDFQVSAKDGTFLIARSMEFAMDLKSNIRNSNRGRQFTTSAPNNKPGLAWKAKYAYLFIDFLNQDNALDGMNEKGLSFEYLYLPGETQYQTVPVGKENQALPYAFFGDWILSNFKTVAEVRQALANIYVFQQMIPGLGSIVFPVHAAIHDASGKGIVVEFIQGQMHIYDFIGVMTNSPTYHWHVSNLRNYINLSPYSPKPMVINNLVFTATGQGAGTLGLPGDISPPSRFIKTAFLSKVAFPVNNAVDALNLAEHIINNVDIPAGLARVLVNGKEFFETTQWVVFKDATHKMFYYRTYNDMTIRAVSMDKIDFSENAKRFKMPLLGNPFIMDVTDKFISLNESAKK